MERESRSPISSICESEDDSVSSASPMSISSAEASSPYTDDTYSSEYTDHHSNPSHHYVVDSPCSSPSPSSLSYDDDHHRWWHCNPYPHCKSVRWYRDDNGLWSEQSRSNRHRSPYHRPTTHRHHAKDQCEALIQAVNRSDYPQLRDILAKNHTNLNILGVEGDSPLHRCCRQGNLEMVKLLVGHGADPELTNRDGWSPLHLAVHCGYQDVVLYLLSLSRR